MVDKINRKLTLIIGAFVVALISLLTLDFRMGLDLRGGTRLLYSIDPEEATAAGLNKDTAVTEVIDVWRKRLDPKGVSGVKLRKEGDYGILVELPATLSIPAKKAEGALGAPFVPGEKAPYLELADATAANDFPSAGRIEFGGMAARYGRRQGRRLYDLTFDKSVTLVEAPAGTNVRLEASDPWRDLIENTGRMEIMMLAKDGDLKGTSTVEAELTKAQEWLAANPATPITVYNDELAIANEGSPLARLRFFPEALDGETEEVIPVADRLLAVILEDTNEHPDWVFTGETFERVFPNFDEFGQPVVAFDIADSKRRAFRAFTAEHGKQQERMAIIVNDEIVTSPSLDEPLNGGGIIRGNFRQDEVERLVRSINSGALKIKPRFEDRQTVGASLGEEYIRKGYISVLLGLLAVLIFTVIYYKRLGVLAAVSLVFNLVLLMGAMAMLQATLTLPGIAGIILTVGMAVDANILIYERIREEALRGRRPAQSAKDGFANALSTIVDANLTTLITAILLYNFGSGPVQGFATTLIVGILTSMFSALVFTRVLVHFALEKGVDEWKMMRAVQETNIGFMALSKKTVFLSAGLIVAGIVTFAAIPRNDKLSIDFVGGMSAQLITSKALKTAQIETALRGIDGFEKEFADAQVQPLLSSADGDGYRKFQVEFKTDAADESDRSAEYRTAIEDGLAGLLTPNRVTFDEAAEGAPVSGTVHFESEHPKPDVLAALEAARIEGVALEGPEAALSFRFTTTSTESTNVLLDRIASAFSGRQDSGGRDMTLAQPIPASSTVGAQVVQKLRDDAILAILLSLFAVVMYIRVRFAEYSYGFAAVIALVHDVLVTLFFLSLAIWSGLINAQISLVMIAAFLTIIGYSLNDTIVVFDRIRENLKPLSGKLEMSEIIDRSINQTLARTVLTSLTTLITVLILFVFNVGSRNDLEGFAFAVIIGVMVGTYSSMFIASPALLILENKRQEKLAAELAREEQRGGPAAVGQ